MENLDLSVKEFLSFRAIKLHSLWSSQMNKHDRDYAIFSRFKVKSLPFVKSPFLLNRNMKSSLDRTKI